MTCSILTNSGVLRLHQVKYKLLTYTAPFCFAHAEYNFFFYNNIYTKLKTNVKKRTTVSQRQYTVYLGEKLKCKNP